MALLTTESELGILLLALLAASAALAVATLLALGSLVNGNVEHVVGVVSRSRAVSLALCEEVG
jgi:hypothetical protein